jgi:4-alpha-glucanotransferase
VDSERVSGVLLHITSLPSAYGIGDLGPAAYRFADFLKQTRQRLWQVLPLGPVGPGASPYSSPSTFAGNPLLISPEPLVEVGLLEPDDLEALTDLPDERVDFERLRPRKREVLTTAYERFRADGSAVDQTGLERYRQDQADWLEDYALYAALKEANDGDPWTDWDPALARRDPDALDRARDRHAEAVRRHVFWQYLFHRQWSALQSYCHARDIRLFGDLPIYVHHDSADVWAHQSLFRLDEDGEPTVVAGVPPDYFSPKGQLWGNPIYRWDRMRENGYRWWTKRMRHVLDRVDLLRLDHFRGFEAFWQVPAGADTAVNGTWADGPGRPFFDALEKELGSLPIVAEDLGVITDEVRELRDALGLPGMAVLQFAFGSGPDNEFLPHNFERNLVAYTGTHDNNTIVGWWNDETSTDDRSYARDYLDLDAGANRVHERCLRTVMASVANRVVFPLQDVIGLGSEARMNVPGDARNNWRWRVTPDQISTEATERLRRLTRIYGRSDRPAADEAATTSPAAAASDSPSSGPSSSGPSSSGPSSSGRASDRSSDDA